MKPRLLFILGMHRSGTSLVTRLCNLCGAGLGEDLIPAVIGDNDGGFWEQQSVVDVNDAIHNHYQTSHLNILPFPNGWEKDSALAPLTNKAAEILEKGLESHAFFALKDPRLSRTLPLWLEAAASLGIGTDEQRALLILRNPLEAAASLHKRNHLPMQEGYALWLEYSLLAERYSRMLERGFIYYPDVLSDWQTALKEAATQAKFEWPVHFEAAASEADAFIMPGLKHNHADDENGNAPLGTQLLSNVFLALREACKNGSPDIAKMDIYWREWAHLTYPYISHARHYQQGTLS